MNEAQSRSGRAQIQQTQTITAIHADLMQAIREGGYLPGSQLPNERQLAERYATSRQQVRDVLLILNEMGLIARKVGSGTWLSDDAPQIIEKLFCQATAQSFQHKLVMHVQKNRLVLQPSGREDPAATDFETLLFQRDVNPVHAELFVIQRRLTHRMVERGDFRCVTA